MMKRIYITLIHLLFIWSAIANNLNNQLWDAIIAGDEQLSIELIKQGADINSLDDKGLALMHRYASAGNEFMIQWLIEHGADVNVTDFEGSTPIFYATINGYYRIVYKLMQLGADVNIVNHNGISPISIAEYYGAKLYVSLFKNPKSYRNKPTTNELYLERQTAISNGEWDRAIALAKQESKQASKEWNKDSPYYTRGLTDLGMIYVQIGRYEEAEDCFNKTIDYWKKILPESEQYFFNLTALAFLYKETNRLEEAAAILYQCIKHLDSFTDYQLVWQVHLNSADIFNVIGNYELAEKGYNNALQCITQLPQILQFDTWCITYGNYALMLYKQNTPETIKRSGIMLSELIELMEQQQHYDQNYLRFKQQLCVYEEDFGDLSIASEIASELIIATKSLLGTEHNDYLAALCLAADIALQQDNYIDAYQYLSNALDIIVNRNYPIQAVEITILNNWSRLLDLILEDTASVWTHEYTYNMASIYGEQSVQYIRQVNDLGVFYSDRRDFDKAIKYQKEAYDLSKKYYGLNNQNTITSEYNLWHTYAAMPTMRDSAYHYLVENDKHVRIYLQNIFGVLSELQREMLWDNNFSSNYSVTIPSFLIDYATINPIAYGDIYNNILLTRGLLLNSNDAFSRIIANTQDTILRNKWQQVLSIKTKLNASQSLDIKERHSLEQQKDKLEREIAQASEDFRLAQENFTINWTDIKSALKDDEVAIEFMINSINHWGQFDNKSDSVMYYALVLRNNYEYPQLVPLFERDEVIHFNYYGKYEGMYDFEIHGDSAYNLIWKKIEPYLTDINTIYFAPTHALAQIALEAIPLSEDTIFGDLYSMVRLSSTRGILKLKDFDIPQSAILYGGVQYDVTSDEMYMESLRYVDELNNITRSVEPIDTIFRGKLSYLPGTKREVENINELFLQSGSNVVTFTGTAANEESFITLSGKHNDVIHIATHGFFWRQQEAATKDVFKQHHSQDYIDPLSRCGLLFAGANMAFQGCSDQIPEGVQDGILTAREISMLDLSGCDLVVLSACETGVGEYSADGTLGLQRAFKQAGVQSIIMTLWPVSDMAAQFMMTEFYRNWITKGQPKRTAFRNAQNAVRSRFSEPTYWAAFIMLD